MSKDQLVEVHRFRLSGTYVVSIAKTCLVGLLALSPGVRTAGAQTQPLVGFINVAAVHSAADLPATLPSGLADAPSTVAARSPSAAMVESVSNATPEPVNDAAPVSASAATPESLNDAAQDLFNPERSLRRAEAHNAKVLKESERNEQCENGELHGKPCRVSWPRVLGESFIFLSSQHLGNIALDKDTRNEVFHGSFRKPGWWGDYFYCIEHYRWSRWKDDDPFGVDYIGHPMMGAVTNSMYEQNDPKQRALTFENTHRYWMGRLRATAYSTMYSAQWKIGPLSEASVGNTGILYYYSTRLGRYTNETGMQDFFVTPAGGLLWNVGEDLIDRHILTHVRHGTHNRLLLLASALTTPGKSAANVSRFRAPYYRDRDLTGIDTPEGRERLMGHKQAHAAPVATSCPARSGRITHRGRPAVPAEESSAGCGQPVPDAAPLAVASIAPVAAVANQ